MMNLLKLNENVRINTSVWLLCIFALNMLVTAYFFSCAGIVMAKETEIDEFASECINYLEGGDYEKALVKADELAARFPDVFSARYTAAVVYYKTGHPVTALEEFQKARELSSGRTDLLKTYNEMGRIYAQLEDYANAYFYASRALEMARRYKNDDAEAIALCIMAEITAGEKADYDRALSYYENALEILKNQGYVSDIYSNMATAYTLKKEYNKAILYYDKAMAYDERRGNFLGVAQITVNTGEMYRRMKKIYDAEDKLKDGLAKTRKIGDKYYEARALKSLGRLFEEKEDAQTAYEYFSGAHDIFKDIKITSEVSALAKKVSFLEKKTKGRFEKERALSSLIEGNYGDALTKLESSFDFCMMYKDYEGAKNIMRTYVETCRKIGRQKALRKYLSVKYKQIEQIKDLEWNALIFSWVGTSYADEKNAGLAVKYYEMARKAYNEAGLAREAGDTYDAIKNVKAGK